MSGLFDTNVSAFKNIEEEEEEEKHQIVRGGADSLRASDDSLSKLGGEKLSQAAQEKVKTETGVV